MLCKEESSASKALNASNVMLLWQCDRPTRIGMKILASGERLDVVKCSEVLNKAEEETES